jgi:hypothetical protein
MPGSDCEAARCPHREDDREGDRAVISSFAYQRDAVGNPISIEREDGGSIAGRPMSGGQGE